jgi:DNA-binding NarL/FixJ family response regulator
MESTHAVGTVLAEQYTLSGAHCPMPQNTGIAPMKRPHPHEVSGCHPIGEVKARKTIPIFSGVSISSEVCMSTMNRILIVDDHALFRDALREFLSQEPDFQIVGEAGNMREAIWSIGTLSPHLVLTDLTMPDTHGIDAVTEIRRHYPDVKILVISFHRENEFKHRCRKAGAAGYVVKDAIHAELRDGIRTVLRGKTYLGVDAPDEMVSDYVIGSAATNKDRSYFLN